MTKERLERTAGLILLGVAGFFLYEAALSVVQAITRRAEEGEAELVLLGQVGAVLFGVVGLVFLLAAVGALRGKTWGKRFALVWSGLFGVLGAWSVLSSPMPWDDSANLGINQTGPVEWFLGLIEVAALLIAFVALLLARSAPMRFPPTPVTGGQTNGFANKLHSGPRLPFQRQRKGSGIAMSNRRGDLIEPDQKPDVDLPNAETPSYREKPAMSRVNGNRDALVGGLIFAVLGSLSVAAHGAWWILTAAEGNPPAYRELFGWVTIGWAVILAIFGVWAARGGRRARYSAGIVGIAMSTLIIGGLPTSIVAIPFIVSVYLLLRSLPTS
jgi:hypothetical protein